MAACLAGLLIWASPAIGGNTNLVIEVGLDGTVICLTNALTSSFAGSATNRSTRYSFGLPDKPLKRGWVEDDGVPVCQTVWEKDGIRYTQKVLVTRLGTNDLTTLRPTDPDAVVLVQITGHNIASEYTTACALLEIIVAGQSLDLELRGGMVFATRSKESAPLAMVDIPGEGIACTNGTQVRFQGNMPPATSGAMTIKIPSSPLTSLQTLERLMDLAFDDELTRLKRAWKKPADAQPRAMPIALAEPGK